MQIMVLSSRIFLWKYNWKYKAEEEVNDFHSTPEKIYFVFAWKQVLILILWSLQLFVWVGLVDKLWMMFWVR